MTLDLGSIYAMMGAIEGQSMFRNNGIYTPEEIKGLSAAIADASAQCYLMGSEGKQKLARAMLQQYQPGTSRPELVEMAKRIVWRQRGLRVK